MITDQDVEMSRKHFEEKMKVTLGPVELNEMQGDSARKQQFVLVDVRNKDAFNKEHIPGAISIPEGELQFRMHELPKDKEIIVYCWTLVCHLAAEAGLLLSQNGFFVRELEGGIAEWKNNDMPVVYPSIAS